jgi:hypothetical protein
MEFAVSPTSWNAATLALDHGSISIRTLLLGTSERLGRSRTRTDQLIDAGSQGGPLSQGCVANAPTAGAGMQTRPSTSRASDVVVALAWCRAVTWASRAIAGAASAVAAISAADRNLAVVIRFLHWIRKANGVGSYLEMEWRSNDRSNISSPCFNAARGSAPFVREFGAVSEVKRVCALAAERNSRPLGHHGVEDALARCANDCCTLKTNSEL